MLKNAVALFIQYFIWEAYRIGRMLERQRERKRDFNALNTNRNMNLMKQHKLHNKPIVFIDV